jgi:hypothetical protein
VYTLLLDVGVDASNFTANGTGLITAHVDRPLNFLVEARSSTVGKNGSIIWGDLLTWATQLAIDVQCVSTFDSLPVLAKVDVMELGGGVYNVSYRVQRGSSYQCYVTVDDVDIPNSPFTVTVAAGVPNAVRSFIDGVGSYQAVKTQPSSLTLHVLDVYGTSNPISTRFILAK